MQLIKYQPFKEIQNLDKELNALWTDGFPSLSGVSDISSIDMYRGGDNLVIDVSLPNFKKREINAKVKAREIAIK